MTPEEKVLRARLAAHYLHSQVDSRAHTEPARKAFMDRFERKVDPDRKLTESERRRRTEQAKKAYFTQLAYKSARARSEGSK